MRGLLAFALLFCAFRAVAQPTETPNLYLTDKQDVTIVARKHPLGSDILTVTVVDTYPKESLVRDIQKLGEVLKSEVLALSVERFNPNPQNPTGGYLRAEFGVRGLIDREQSKLGLQALAQAFMGGKPPDQIDSLFIQYETEAPSTSILRQWKSDDGSILVQGRASPQFGIEYKVKVFGVTDASKIRIPEGADAVAPPATPPKPPAPSRSDGWIWALVVISALAIGALVYSLLIRPRPTTRS
jgi:hypothetical protein